MLIRTLFLTLSLLCFAQVATSTPRDLASTSQPGFGLTLQENRSANFTLTVKSSGIKLLNAFLVENPNRLVVDLSGAALKQNKNLSVPGSQEISGVRLGVHADKLRVVIDLKTKLIPNFVSQNPNGEVEVQFSFSGGEAAIITAPSEPIVSPTAVVPSHVVPTETPPTLAPKATLAPTNPPATAVPTSPPPTLAPTAVIATAIPTKAVPTLEPTKASEPIAPAVPVAPTVSEVATVPLPPSSSAIVIDPSKQELAGIFFEHFGPERTPVLRLALSRRGEFRFSKVDDQSYELTLPGYSLAAPHLALPQFPPQDFEGMTFLKAMPHSSGIQVMIGIVRGTRLSPIAKDSDVLVKIGG